jgi:hypothetical protein
MSDKIPVKIKGHGVSFRGFSEKCKGKIMRHGNYEF